MRAVRSVSIIFGVEPKEYRESVPVIAGARVRRDQRQERLCLEAAKANPTPATMKTTH